jgi:hypothetical protein
MLLCDYFLYTYVWNLRTAFWPGNVWNTQYDPTFDSPEAVALLTPPPPLPCPALPCAEPSFAVIGPRQLHGQKLRTSSPPYCLPYCRP